MFSQRHQGEDKTVEEYAAELKKLFDKAYSGRDSLTRKEDLLRRFLDGLKDSEVRQGVEYVKDPEDIDETVYQVLSFIQLRDRADDSPCGERKRRNSVRRSPDSEDEMFTESNAGLHITNSAAERDSKELLVSRSLAEGSQKSSNQEEGPKREQLPLCNSWYRRSTTL